MKVCIVLSTRPEIIKLSPLISIFKKKKVNFFIINTNQHYSKRMSKVFFNFFKIPKPKYNLKANSKSHKIFFSKAINNIEKILNKEKPNILIVQGDTNTALAGCKAASNFNAKLKKNEYKIKIAHVEAGLRSFDKKMPEERNRIVIDQIADILFVPTNFDIQNLKKEKLIQKKHVFKVGNTISDVIKAKIKLINKSKIRKKIKLNKNKYFLLTLHRPETVDKEKKLIKLINIFEKLGKKFDKKFIFPIHPRTKKILKKTNIKKINFIKFIDPLDFIDFLYLMKNSRTILTDSGGIQEESSLLGIPCVTIRTTTERQLSISNKSNILTGYKFKKISNAISYFERNKVKPSSIFGNGKVSIKIYEVLVMLFKKY